MVVPVLVPMVVVCILFIFCWQSKHLDTYVSNALKLFMIITFSINSVCVCNTRSHFKLHACRLRHNALTPIPVNCYAAALPSTLSHVPILTPYYDKWMALSWKTKRGKNRTKFIDNNMNYQLTCEWNLLFSLSRFIILFLNVIVVRNAILNNVIVVWISNSQVHMWRRATRRLGKREREKCFGLVNYVKISIQPHEARIMCIRRCPFVRRFHIFVKFSYNFIMRRLNGYPIQRTKGSILSPFTCIIFFHRDL